MSAAKTMGLAVPGLRVLAVPNLDRLAAVLSHKSIR